MKASKRLAVVVDQAKREEDDAAKQFEVARKRLAEEEEKLKELGAYYQEYESQFKSSGVGIRASELAGKREFLQQLALSHAAQTQFLLRIKEEYEQKKQRWLTCHLKHKNLNEYVAQLAQKEENESERLAQKMLDEWSSQQQGRKSLG